MFRTDCKVITCPVNTVGVMGKGLALYFKQRYKELNAEYRRACKEEELVVGRPWLYENHCYRDILLFPTKEHWSRPSRIEWIDEGLDYLRCSYEDYGIESLALPPLGCGNGGLDYFHDLKPLLHKHLDDIPIPVEIYIPEENPF